MIFSKYTFLNIIIYICFVTTFYKTFTMGPELSNIFSMAQCHFLPERTLDNGQHIEQQNELVSKRSLENLSFIIEELKTQMFTLGSEKNALAKAMSEIKVNQSEQINTLTTQYEEISLAKILLEEELKKTKASTAQLLKTNSELSKKIASLEQQLTTTHKEAMQERARQIKNAEASEIALEKGLRNQKLTIEEIQKEKESLAGQLALTKQALDEEIKAQNERLNKLNDEIQKLTAANNDLQKQNLDLQQASKQISEQTSKQISVGGKLKELLKKIFTKRTLVDLALVLGLLSFYNQKFIVSCINNSLHYRF